MSDAPEPLSPELTAFLDPERRRPDPSAETESALFSRIGATLGFPGGPGPGGSDPPGGAPPSGHAGGGHVGGGHVGGGGLAVLGAKHLASGSLSKTLATLLVGGVLGSGVHEAYDRASNRRAVHAKVDLGAPMAARSTPPPAVAPPTVAVPEPTATSAGHTESPPARAEHIPRVELRERDRGLGAERALIEQARTALAREKNAAALTTLERHAREFPQGELEEERESLLVQALVGLERFDQARKVGARFHRRFPRSIFGAVVDEALRSIP